MAAHLTLTKLFADNWVLHKIEQMLVLFNITITSTLLNETRGSSLRHHIESKHGAICATRNPKAKQLRCFTRNKNQIYPFYMVLT